MPSSAVWPSISTPMDDERTLVLNLLADLRQAANGLESTRTSKHPVSQSNATTQRVFVSWAHANSGWSEEAQEDWQSKVVKFAMGLRANGVDADIDLFHLEDTSVDWTRFGPQKIQESDTVLIVMSEGWAERWSGTNKPMQGAGAVGEADELLGLFQRNQAEFQRRCLVVMFNDVPTSVLPGRLNRLNRFSIDPYDPDSYEALLRTLTNQPRFGRPSLGPLPSFATLEDSDINELTKEAKAAERKRTRSSSDLSDQDKDALSMRESVIKGLIESLRDER